MTTCDPSLLTVKVNYLQSKCRPLEFAKYMVVGGAGSRSRMSFDEIRSLHQHEIEPGRYNVLKTFKDILESDRAQGASAVTIKNKVYAIHGLYVWADKNSRKMTPSTVAEDAVAYGRHLFSRAYVAGTLSKESAYQVIECVANMLSLYIDRKLLLRASGFRRKPVHRRHLDRSSDKLTLEAGFQFINLLHHLCEQLTLPLLTGPLPMVIPLPNRKAVAVFCANPVFGTPFGQCIRQQGLHIRSRHANPKTAISSRNALLNLAFEANLLLFIACTGMNSTQAMSLCVREANFQTSPDDDNIIKVYKGRRGGNAEFEIPRSYRPQFERLLRLRSALYGHLTGKAELFLFVYRRRGRPGVVSAEHQMSRAFVALRSLCKQLGIRFVSPQRLRRIWVNWTLRASKDPQLTAQMAQHTREVLAARYADPNFQETSVEISRFHMATEERLQAAMPGQCEEATPTRRPDAPAVAPKPDCISAAGCLFCTHYRGVDSFDYVWSLTTFRYLKLLQLGGTPPVAQGNSSPAVATVERASQILDEIRVSSPGHAAWIDEAQERVQEGNYHTYWIGSITSLEARI